MKILHIWNTAGVGSIIAKYMDRIYGTESWVVMRKSFDKFGFTTCGELWKSGAKMFVLRSLWEARQYDIYHVHGLDRILPLLKSIYGKPVVLHYHGTDVRDKWGMKRKYWEKADSILYCTTELVGKDTPKTAIWLPNPVDTEIFYPRDPHEPGMAFSFSYKADDLALDYAKQHGIRLFVHNREAQPIPYSDLPNVLSKYEYYIDFKRLVSGKVGEALSKTALEALACGCKVIRWDGKVISELPAEHKPENVVKQVWEIYSKLPRTACH